MKPHIVWDFICIQIVCKGHQRSSKFTASGLRVKWGICFLKVVQDTHWIRQVLMYTKHETVEFVLFRFVYHLNLSLIESLWVVIFVFDLDEIRFLCNVHNDLFYMAIRGSVWSLSCQLNDCIIHYSCETYIPFLMFKVAFDWTCERNKAMW